MGIGGNGDRSRLGRSRGRRANATGRLRPYRRRMALLCAISILGSLLTFPALAVTTSAPAAAADVPDCLPGESPPNCLPADTLPDGVERPPVGELGAPVQIGPTTVRQAIGVTGPELGGLCPDGSVPFSRMPCTRRGVSAGGGAHVEPGTEPPRGVNVTHDPNGPDCNYTPDHSCTLWIVYNPAWITGTVNIVISVSTTIFGDLNGDGNILEGMGYSFVVSISGTGTTPPTAAFSSSGVGNAEQQMVFRAESTDPGGSALLHEWTFGDGATATGAVVGHTYARPGRYDVTLKSTNTFGRSGSVTKSVTVTAPTLSLGIELLDGAAPPLAPDTPVRARVTVAASSDGVGPIDGIHFTDGALLRVSPADAFVITDGPNPELPTAGFSLQPGATRSFEVTLEPEVVGRYTITSQVTGTDQTGTRQTADADSPGEIGEALKITIALDPPTADQDEGPDGPVPIDVTATIAFENTTPVAMDTVTMTSLRVDRTAAGQLLAVTQTGGADPGEDGLAIGSLAPGQKREVTATFRATDDAEVEFSAMAVAHTVDDREEIGLGKKRWKVTPKYLVALTSRVTNPPSGTLLPAGELIRVSGTVRNLSTTATVELGPLYPVLSGNASTMSLAWDEEGTDPTAMVPAENVVLEPGESANFTVRALTSWSDPRRLTGPGGAGGTRADLTFTPYGKATFEDGTEVAIGLEEIKTTEADLTHRVSIDDSIAIPTKGWTEWFGAISVGVVEGLGSAAASIVTGVVDLAEAPFTVTSALCAAQAQIWDSFSEVEKEEFARDVALMSFAVLKRNAQFAAREAGPLIDQISANTLQIMTELENESRVGDWTRAVEAYSRWGADAVGQVVIPVALAKMAKSPRAVAALARAQAELQTRMAPLLQRSLSVTRIEDLAPILAGIASGTEPDLAEMARLFGVSADEYVEAKKLADKYGVLLTVRSRHASSIRWIEQYQALLKPETLKIKSVSELDELLLDYPTGTTGSLVFKKPEPLKVFDAGTKPLGEAINDFVISRGFEPGTSEWQNAVNRVAQRAREWRQWEKTYKYWDDRGWIDVSMNYKGNAIDDTVRKGRSALDIAPLSSGKYKGFRLRSVGEDTYVVEMFDHKTGRFVPITGDIDPIAFTNLDGSPLTAEVHADLLDDMARNPLLQAQHGESATYSEGGLDFIESQFKGEPLLQIAPGDSKARVVRFNREGSRWENPFDYHLRWDGGFVYSGSYVPRTARPQPAIVIPAAVVPRAARASAIPAAVDSEPNVGRCRFTYGTPGQAANALVDSSGKLRRLRGDGTATDDASLHSECFSPGPTVEHTIAPITGLTEDATVGQTEIEIPDDPFLAQAGTDVQVGDEVVIGAGTPEAETHTVGGFGSIILSEGLERDWPAGTLILVTSRTQAPPTTAPPTTAPPTTATPSTASSAMGTGTTPRPPSPTTVSSLSPAGSGGGSDGTSLAVTGSDSSDLLPLSLALIVVGLLSVAESRRRRLLPGLTPTAARFDTARGSGRIHPRHRTSPRQR